MITTIQLVTMFAVSVDEYIFPDKEVKKSSVRRRLNAELDKLNDKELSVIEATVIGLCKARKSCKDFIRMACRNASVPEVRKRGKVKVVSMKCPLRLQGAGILRILLEDNACRAKGTT